LVSIQGLNYRVSEKPLILPRWPGQPGEVKGKERGKVRCLHVQDCKAKLAGIETIERTVK
jgi:hypothetical protein